MAIVDDHIQNSLPVHLLSLPSMKMVSKRDIREGLGGSAIAGIARRCPALRRTPREAWIRQRVQEQMRYAILSHRWLPTGELTYQEMSTITTKYTTEAKAKGMSGTMVEMMYSLCAEMSEDQKVKCGGFVKLVKFCNIAWREYRCQYVWFDTGCINKESSAELEESIRSMFSWYRNSAICVVQLNQTSDAPEMPRDPWFKRGWTLQELLAPKTIKFFDQSWYPIIPIALHPNDKVPDAELGVPLWKTISKITDIPVDELLSFTPGIGNVRQRMTWASRRKTTRIEDMAYCLIGIFDIALSVAYGEGPMAFHRLQLEIMMRSDDKRLFAWNGKPSAYNSMFAAEPKCFVQSNLPKTPDVADTTYGLTNRGLHIILPVYEVQNVRDYKENEYKLEVQGLGTITAAFLDKPEFTHLSVAILFRGVSNSAVVILLGRGTGTRQYTRIATRDILTFEGHPYRKDPEMIFIV
jgi:hypothetical protein